MSRGAEGVPPAPSGVPETWSRYGSAVAWAGVAYLAVAAVGKLLYAVPHLLRDVEAWSAVDLKYRFTEVRQWFGGEPVYGVVDGAVYPPASHAILWPFLGWLDLEGARLLWLATTLLALSALAVLAYRLCRPAPQPIRLLVAGLLPAAYPAQMSVFVGQMGVHVLAFAALGALLVLTGRERWERDLAGGTLLALSLVKPTLALPLVVTALVVSGRWRPTLCAVGAYVALTFVAAAAQPDGLPTLVQDWLTVSGERVSIMEGVPNLHLLLAWLGLERWAMGASLLALLGLGVWSRRRRNADSWVLLGAAAVVARLWTHSRLYDDALLLLVVIGLLRVAIHSTADLRRVAAIGFVAGWLALLTPTWAFYDLGSGVLHGLHAFHLIVWGVALIVLALAATRTRPETSSPPAPAGP